jgi:hypothetical protein
MITSQFVVDQASVSIDRPTLFVNVELRVLTPCRDFQGVKEDIMMVLAKEFELTKRTEFVHFHRAMGSALSFSYSVRANQ